jgi:hypothetical protein
VSWPSTTSPLSVFLTFDIQATFKSGNLADEQILVNGGFSWIVV